MTKIEQTVNLMKEENTFKRYQEGDHTYKDFSKQIFNEDKSHKCPTYIHKTPPCQGSCPSGEDIRGWPSPDIFSRWATTLTWWCFMNVCRTLVRLILIENLF